MDRRNVLAGAGTVGALAVAAAVLPRGLEQPKAAPKPGAARAQESGYRLTEHVLQYYQTARV